MRILTGQLLEGSGRSGVKRGCRNRRRTWAAGVDAEVDGDIREAPQLDFFGEVEQEGERKLWVASEKPRDHWNGGAMEKWRWWFRWCWGKRKQREKNDGARMGEQLGIGLQVGGAGGLFILLGRRAPAVTSISARRGTGRIAAVQEEEEQGVEGGPWAEREQARRKRAGLKGERRR